MKQSNCCCFKILMCYCLERVRSQRLAIAVSNSTARCSKLTPRVGRNLTAMKAWKRKTVNGRFHLLRHHHLHRNVKNEMRETLRSLRVNNLRESKLRSKMTMNSVCQASSSSNLSMTMTPISVVCRSSMPYRIIAVRRTST